MTAVDWLRDHTKRIKLQLLQSGQIEKQNPLSRIEDSDFDKRKDLVPRAALGTVSNCVLAHSLKVDAIRRKRLRGGGQQHSSSTIHEIFNERCRRS